MFFVLQTQVSLESVDQLQRHLPPKITWNGYKIHRLPQTLQLKQKDKSSHWVPGLFTPWCIVKGLKLQNRLRWCHSPPLTEYEVRGKTFICSKCSMPYLERCTVYYCVKSRLLCSFKQMEFLALEDAKMSLNTILRAPLLVLTLPYCPVFLLWSASVSMFLYSNLVRDKTQHAMFSWQGEGTGPAVPERRGWR